MQKAGNTEVEAQIETVKTAVEAVLENPCNAEGTKLHNAVDDLAMTLNNDGCKVSHIGKALATLNEGIISCPGGSADTDKIIEGAKEVQAALFVPVEKDDKAHKTDSLTADAIGRAKQDMAARPHRTPGVEPF